MQLENGLEDLLKKQIKKQGFTIETITKSFCDEIAKKINGNDTEFVGIFLNIEDIPSIAICDACGCGTNSNGFEVLEELQPTDLLDTKTRNILKITSLAGFGIKKINAKIMDGLDVSLRELSNKYNRDCMLVMGKTQCVDRVFVVVAIDRRNLEVITPLTQISISDAMQQSEDIKNLF